MKNVLKNNWSWMLAVIISFVTIIILAISAGFTPFGKYSLATIDGIAQYVPFLSEYKYKLMNHESFLYSWDLGMGSDFFAVYAYYLTSPLNLFVLFFDKFDLDTAFTIMVFFKIIVCSGTMGYYLSRKDGKVENNILVTAFSLGYAFSGYIAGYYWNYMWLDCIAVFPILLIGMDRLIKDNKPVLFIVSLFYSMFCNFYFSFMICIFLVLWFFVYHYDNVKDFFIKGIRFALSSILAAGMAGIIIIVSFYSLIVNSASNDSMQTSAFYGEIFEKLSGQYFLSIPWITEHNNGLANVYCGVITFILLFFFILNKKISVETRIKKIVIVCFLFLSMEFSFLNYIWHGFHNQIGIPNRFSIFYIFLLLDIGYSTLSEMEGIGIKRFAVAGITTFFLPIVIYFFVDYIGFVDTKTMLLIALGMTFVYLVLILIEIYGKKAQVKYIIAGMLMVEMCSSFYISLKYNEPLDTRTYMDLLKQKDATIEYIDGLETDETDFFRQEMNRTSIENETIFLNMKGTGVFSSLVDYNVLNVMAYLGFEVGSPYYHYPSATRVSPLMDDMLGVRYIHSNNDNIDDSGYELLHYTEDGRYVFKNEDALSVGFGVNEALYYENNVKDYNSPENQNIFVELSTGLEGPFESVAQDVMAVGEGCEAFYDPETGNVYCDNIADTTSDYVDVYIYYQVKEAGTYFFEIGNSYYYDMEIYQNEDILMSGEFAWQQVSLGKLNADDQIAFIYHIPAHVSDEIITQFYMAKYDHDKEIAAVEKLSENEFNVTDYSAGTLEGDIDMKEGQLLMFTIPYHDAWTVYVDGVKSDKMMIMGGFLGLNLTPGTHHIRMEYKTPGLVLGIIVSAVSWIILILLCVIKIKSSKSEVKEINNSSEGSEVEENNTSEE